MAHLERRKRYPADVGFSGFPALYNEVLSLVRRVSPVPAPPPGANKTITAPVRFDLR